MLGYTHDMSTYYQYPVAIQWQGGRSGEGSLELLKSHVATLPISIPTEFKGAGKGTDPEELLSAAIASCYTITLAIIAEQRRLPIKNIQTEAIGMSTIEGGTLVFKQVIVRPLVTSEGPLTPEQRSTLDEVIELAEQRCIVLNTMRDKVDVSLEPEIVSG